MKRRNKTGSEIFLLILLMEHTEDNTAYRREKTVMKGMFF